ncbi:EF-P lysine aminoacylase GenX [Pajaroellobacter abortibovis]|uniref:EF-P lysine aminoacylase GenX n=1 Tax=Pajaroellobacter abortibovis TaxID=1882918 RepID=A0A1L6MWA6_9BACT|nr:EF-P lysine aminoacylase GenX [Pajaroellobacter abortibovis]
MHKHLVERAHIISAIRHFFEERAFLEVETPLLVPSPGLDLHLNAFEVLEGRTGKTYYLSTSPEYQMKRLLAEGYSKIMQITKCFRQGEIGERHNPEFTMVEWYRASAGMEDMIKDTEELIGYVTGGVVRLDNRVLNTSPPFARITVCEAFERYASFSPHETLALAADAEDDFFRLLVETIEPALAQLDHALFLTDYPATQASLARTKPENRLLAERFELYIAGVELCNGFGELVDPQEQRFRLEQEQAKRRASQRPVYPIDERFLTSLAQGIPPSGGNALGVDRLVALTCGTNQIQQVISFTIDEL